MYRLEDGAVWVGWRKNCPGCIMGLGNDCLEYSKPQLINTFFSKYPEIVKLEKINIVSVSAGCVHSLFLSDNGKVFSCGNDFWGQCGHNGTKYGFLTEVAELSQVTDISAGEIHSLALTKDGSVYCCGTLCSSGDTAGTTLVFTKIEEFSNRIITAIAAGYHRSAFLTSNHEVIEKYWDHKPKIVCQCPQVLQIKIGISKQDSIFILTEEKLKILLTTFNGEYSNWIKFRVERWTPENHRKQPKSFKDAALVLLMLKNRNKLYGIPKPVLFLIFNELVKAQFHDKK